MYFWHGLSLWIGYSSGRTRWHAHYALQLTLTFEGMCGFRTVRDGPWTQFNGAVVPSNRPHQFEVDGWPMAHMFVEPETLEGRALVRRFGTRDIAAIPEPLRDQMAGLLLGAGFRRASERDLELCSRRAVALLVDPIPLVASIDPRVARALDYVRAQLQRSLTLEDVARAVSLSSGRLRHLLVTETGTTYRAFVLWARLNRAIAAAMEGASWTDAAHAAGFADSAHLTRTFKRMFGIVPIALARPSQAAAEVPRTAARRQAGLEA